jgi:hypothetical protein
MAYREGLPERPARIMALPLDERGYPVPYFVAWFDGKPDFRVADELKMIQCIRGRRCWICGGPLGKFQTFAIGPMCAVNRVSSEPPAHLECAHYAARACPFLLMPSAGRRSVSTMPEGTHVHEMAHQRNPGVILLWTSTLPYRPFKNAKNILFEVPEPTSLEFWSAGREATPAEIWESFESGVEILRAGTAPQGAQALATLAREVRVAIALLPPRPAVELEPAPISLK